MRAVVSRVDGASVTVGPAVVGAVRGPGLLALVGVSRTDDVAAATRLADRVAALRLFPAAAGQAAERSVEEVGGGVLVVSQFTLYGDTAKGRRPSWNGAAPGPDAEPLVAAVVARLRERGLVVATGLFGAQMRVASVNDGPFTVLVET